MLAAFCGALAGFLVYNRNPASIFMGDCGSLFIGFFLAGTRAAQRGGGGGRRAASWPCWPCRCWCCCIPIFDTTFVHADAQAGGARRRRRAGAITPRTVWWPSASPRRHAVWMLYAFAILGGVLAMLVRHSTLDVSLGAIAGLHHRPDACSASTSAACGSTARRVAAAQRGRWSRSWSTSRTSAACSRWCSTWC